MSAVAHDTLTPPALAQSNGNGGAPGAGGPPPRLPRTGGPGRGALWPWALLSGLLWLGLAAWWWVRERRRDEAQ